MPMEKTFNAAEAEARITAQWLDQKVGRAGANARPGAEAFSIMIPPPNVTGSLHMGHAFNNTLQDILTRWHRMQGDDTLWQPGTDHAGIATQMVTEREMARNGEPTRREMGREAFLGRVWAQKAKSRGTIIGQLQRLGASCDWDREAFTMSGAPGAPAGEEGNFHDAVIKVFVEMYNKGLIYRGKRLVNWDPKFETAISDLEVENKEVEGHMWHFKYPLAGGETYTYIEKDADGNVVLALPLGGGEVLCDVRNLRFLDRFGDRPHFLGSGNPDVRTCLEHVEGQGDQRCEQAGADGGGAAVHGVCPEAVEKVAGLSERPMRARP